MIIFQIIEKMWELAIVIFSFIFFALKNIVSFLISLYILPFILIYGCSPFSPEKYLSIEDIQGTWVPTQRTVYEWVKNTEATNQLVFRADGTFTAIFQGPLPFGIEELFINIEEGEDTACDYAVEGTFHMTKVNHYQRVERGDRVELEWNGIKEGGEKVRYMSSLDVKVPENSGFFEEVAFRPQKGKDFNLFFYMGDPDSCDTFVFERKKEPSQETKSETKGSTSQ